MILLTCKCGAKVRAIGEYDPETNCTEIIDIRGDWEGGEVGCEHQEYEIEELEYDTYGDEAI